MMKHLQNTLNAAGALLRTAIARAETHMVPPQHEGGGPPYRSAICRNHLNHFCCLANSTSPPINQLRVSTATTRDGTARL